MEEKLMKELPLWIRLAIANDIDTNMPKRDIINLLRQWGIPISSDGKRYIK